jgi:hypothetical protein
MLTLQQRIKQNLLQQRTKPQTLPPDSLAGKEKIEFTNEQIQRMRNYGQPAPTPVQQPAKTTFGQDLTSVAQTVTESKPSQFLQKVPGTILEGVSKAVGGVVGLLGALEGGIVGGIAQTGIEGYKSITQGKKFDIGNVWDKTIADAKATAKFGYNAGKKGTEMAPLAINSAILGTVLVYESAERIFKTFGEIGTAYENYKMYGKNSPTIRATYDGLVKGSSEGWQMIGLDKETANKISQNNIGASFGNLFLYGTAYLGARGVAYGIKGEVNKLPYIRVKSTGQSIIIPADPILRPKLQEYFANQLRNQKGYTVTATVDGVEILTPFKLSEGEIATRVAKMPQIKGWFKFEGYEKTAFGRLMSPLGEPTRAIKAEYIPETEMMRTGTPQPTTAMTPRLPVAQTPTLQRGVVTAAPVAQSVIQPTAPVTQPTAPVAQPTAPQTAFQMIPQKQVESINKVKNTLQQVKAEKLRLGDEKQTKEIKEQVSLLNRIITNLEKKLQQPAKGAIQGPEVKTQVQPKVVEQTKISEQPKEVKVIPKSVVSKTITTKQEKIKQDLNDAAMGVEPTKYIQELEKAIQDPNTSEAWKKQYIKTVDKIKKLSLQLKETKPTVTKKVGRPTKSETGKTQAQIEAEKPKKAVGRPIKSKTGKTAIQLEKEALKHKGELMRKIREKTKEEQRNYERIIQSQKEGDRIRMSQVKQEMEEIRKEQAPGEVITRKMTEEEMKQYGVDKARIEAKSEVAQISEEIRKQNKISDYKHELAAMKSRGATQEDFYKLLVKEQAKEFEDIDTYLKDYSNSDIIIDFIEEHYGYNAEASMIGQEGKVSIKMLLDPIKPIETALNKGWEYVVKGSWKLFHAQNLVLALRQALYKVPLVNWFGKKIVYDYRLPEWYKGLKEMADSEKITSENTAREMMEYLNKGLSEVQKIELQGAIINHGIHSDPDISARATVARSVLDRYGENYWKVGAISQEVFEANKGQYLPRLYYDYELNKPLIGWGTRGGYKATLDRARKRGIEKIVSDKNVTDWVQRGWVVRGKVSEAGKVRIWRDYNAEELKAMKQIIDQPGYLTAKAIREVGHDVAVLRLFQEVAKHPDFVQDDLIVTNEKGQKITIQPISSFKQLPETVIAGKKAYGALAGKWVDPYIYEDIKGIVEAKNFGANLANQMLAHWKAWKVVDNPATHFRNMYFNFILSDVAGLSPMRVDIYGSALVDIFKKNPDFVEARNAGLFGTSWAASGELAKVLNDKKILTMRQAKDGTYVYDWQAIIGSNIFEFFDKLKGIYGKSQQMMAKMYQAEEEWNKLALYKFAKNDLDMGKEEATKFAKKWGLNYQAVSPAVSKYGQSWYGAPFVRFSLLAAPRLAEGVLFRPFTILKWLLIMYAIEETSRKTFNLAREELNRIKQHVFPVWMQQGVSILAPKKDENDNYQFLDLTYIIPFIQDIKGMEVYNYIFGNPFFRLPAEVMLNRSAFTGQDIYNKELNPSLMEITTILSKYVYQQIVPPIAPGGYNFEKMWKAALNKKDVQGRVTDLVGSISTAIFGLKLRSVDVTEETKWRQLDLKNKEQAIKNKMNSVWGNQGMSDNDKKKEIEKYLYKLQDLYKEANDLMGDSYSESLNALFNK